jgi:hypothetical protein
VEVRRDVGAVEPLLEVQVRTVTLPVSPRNPTGWPWSMVMPATSQVSFMWAYSVERPAPWSMIA